VGDAGSESLKHYHVTGVFGEAENGKTTYMVGEVMSDADLRHDHTEFYSNIHISHPKVKFVNREEMLALRCPTDKGIAKGLLAIDQIHKYFDSRRSQSLGNKEFSDFVIESRQHGLDLIYTTWMRSAVDKRLRPFTNLYVLAQRGARGFEYTRVDKDQGTELPFVTMPWARAQQVWNRFDSTELIEDATIPAK